jgi:hypothetical protein
VQPGANLFGDTPDGEAKLILDGLAQRFARDDAFPAEADLLDLAPAEPAGAAGVDLRADAGGGDGKGVQPSGGGRPAEGVAPPTAPAKGDLWQLSQEELTALRDEKALGDEAKLVKALGEDGAKEFNRLYRATNSADPARADAASAEFDKKFGNLTPEQERLIYGIGEVDAQVEDLDALIRAHSDVMQGDPEEWAAYVAALGVRKASVEDMRLVPQGRGSIEAQAAFVRISKSYEELARQGVAANQIPDKMAEALVNHAGWTPQQANQVIGGFVNDMVRGRVKPEPPAAKVLPAPGVAEGAPAAAKPKALDLIDPELRDLADRDLEAAGEVAPKDDPDTIAEAVRAAAVCLQEGGL